MAEAVRTPRLIVFSDTARIEPERMLERFAALASGARAGSVLFTLRDYQLPLRARWALGKQLQLIAFETKQGFGFAERADVARALGCPAFHLPERGLSATDARRYLGPTAFLSRGSHDANAPGEPDLDAVLLSPIFEARKGRAALGASVLASACQERPAGAPALYALGAVNAQNAASCLSAGAAGVAVIGAAVAPDPERLLDALGISRA